MAGTTSVAGINRSHKPILLSSLMSYNRIYNNSNTTGTTSGAGIDRSQYHILLSSLITSYRISNKNNTRDTTCGAGTAYHLELLSSLLVFF